MERNEVIAKAEEFWISTASLITVTDFVDPETNHLVLSFFEENRAALIPYITSDALPVAQTFMFRGWFVNEFSGVIRAKAVGGRYYLAVLKERSLSSFSWLLFGVGIAGGAAVSLYFMPALAKVIADFGAVYVNDPTKVAQIVAWMGRTLIGVGLLVAEGKVAQFVANGLLDPAKFTSVMLEIALIRKLKQAYPHIPEINALNHLQSLDV
jgi:hypothetical protein